MKTLARILGLITLPVLGWNCYHNNLYQEQTKFLNNFENSYGRIPARVRAFACYNIPKFVTDKSISLEAIATITRYGASEACKDYLKKNK